LQRHRYEELVHVQERTPEENLEMAECALSLVEAGVFGKRQLERARRTLKQVPSDPKQQACGSVCTRLRKAAASRVCEGARAEIAACR
jgi:hypothetical protein